MNTTTNNTNNTTQPLLHASTHLIHHPYQPPEGFVAPQPGVFKASTVIFPSVAALRSREWKDKTSYTYGLHGTPTTYQLEERLATLEGARQCLLVPSGLAALATVGLALLQAGDEVLIPDNAYGPNKALAQVELAHYGIRHTLYDPLNVQDLADKITPATRLVWLEAAGSVTLEFPDLPALIALCRVRGVWCALDNTWGAGIAFTPFDLHGDGRLGVDICAHALTKYPSGGGDVLMGSITTRDQALHLRLKMTHMRLGLGVGANDVEAILRSLPSMALRYHAHDQTTRALAQWLSQQEGVAQVLHPALAGSPGHEHWRAVCSAAAGLVSVVFDPRYSGAQVDAFCERLQLFKIGYSWGGPISLVMPYDLPSLRECATAHLRPGTLVRFALGLEALQDLRADLAQAWASTLACP